MAQNKALRHAGPSSIIHITNAIDDNVNSLKVNITPVQFGSGDPSPDNVRPISGWTGARVEVRGRNLLDPLEFRLVNSNFGTIVSADRETGSIHFTYEPGFRYSGISIFSAGILTTKALKPGKYICSFDISGTIITAWTFGARRVRDYTFQGAVTIFAPGHYSFQIDTSTWGAEDCFISWSRTGNQDTALDVTISNIILTPGTTEAAFEPYNGTTYDITFPTEAGTVYGGTLDVTTGLLTVTHGNIASYNGESLPGKWISSMDVYSAGGTPTTDAQVVYELATPQTYQLTPTQIALLAGENNVWADCGDILKIRYWSSELLMNKVVYSGNTLIDLTGDTITSDVLLSGYIAHDATGSEIEGSLEIATLAEVKAYLGIS